MKDLKTWQKVGLGILTIGVTGTAIFYGYKALKKRMDKVKNTPVPQVKK